VAEVREVVFGGVGAVVGFDALGHCLEFGFGAGEEGDVEALGNEAAGDGFAYAGAGADEGYDGFGGGVERHGRVKAGVGLGAEERMEVAWEVRY